MPPDEFAMLEVFAKQQHTSVGELIRQAVRERYLMGHEQRKTAAETLIGLGLPALAVENLDGVLTIARTEGLR
jgi:hypothetical protein